MSHRELRPLACDDPKGGVGGKFKREWIYVYSWLIHCVVWQKLTHIVKQLSSN